ncbi:hypothetical protein SAY87_013439 [Trapa incisa]|uniref:Uncharacterized protein n=1 Tax=Trapa incisa TaxID=236973 RepID=A0AAN7KH59_9MYRT|nr:hypothetical protein SAY87_013439 [Trapa incisa]
MAGLWSGLCRGISITRPTQVSRIVLLCFTLVTAFVLLQTILTSQFRLSENYNSGVFHYKSRKQVELHRVLEEEVPAVATSDQNSYLALNISKILDDEDDTVLANDDDERPDKKENLSEPYRLGRKISNWDHLRSKWLKNNPGRQSTVGSGKRPRVLLVTGSSPEPCTSPVGDHLLLKSIKNKMDYGRLHGMEVFYSMAVLAAEMGGFWAKLPLIKELMLGHPEAEFLWWMDSDALFTDMAFEVPWERYKDYNLVLHGWSEKVYDQKDWIGLNTGSFMIRNCQWSLDLLDAWAIMGPKGKVREEAGKLLTKELKGRPPFEADDQSAMIYLLASQRHIWGDKVYLENSYCLHGYWDYLVDKYEELMDKHKPGLGDDRWPLVTHFVGCKPCASSGHYPAERCLRQMNRAFGFADNQVIKAYGFAHVSLGSRRVKRIHRQGKKKQSVK